MLVFRNKDQRRLDKKRRKTFVTKIRTVEK